MALPGIVMPSSLPDWLRAPHEVEPESIYGDASMQAGAARRRRLRSVAPINVRCQMLVRGDLHEVWHGFHERVLLAGSRRFTARVKNWGPGHRWFEAECLSYTWDPRPSLRRYALITVTLRLWGDGELAPPELGSFEGAVRVPLDLTARIVLPTLLRGAVSVPLDLRVAGAPLLGAVTVAAEVLASLQALAGAVVVGTEVRYGPLTLAGAVVVLSEVRIGDPVFSGAVAVACEVTGPQIF